jgi:hypothetical protein
MFHPVEFFVPTTRKENTMPRRRRSRGSGASLDTGKLQRELRQLEETRLDMERASQGAWDSSPQWEADREPIPNFCGSWSCQLTPSECYDKHRTREAQHRCASGSCGVSARACEGSFIELDRAQAPKTKCRRCGNLSCPGTCSARKPGLQYVL